MSDQYDPYDPDLLFLERERLRAEALRLREQRDTLLAALKDLVREIRAYQSPECDDEGAIGAKELKAADAAIKLVEEK